MNSLMIYVGDTFVLTMKVNCDDCDHRAALSSLLKRKFILVLHVMFLKLVLFYDFRGKWRGYVAWNKLILHIILDLNFYNNIGN